MIVRLSLDESKIAYAIALERQADSMRRGLNPKHGASDDLDTAVGLHLLGVAGEIAVAKGLGIYWAPTVGTFKMPDLASNIQVRARANDKHDLIVRQDDSDTDVYVLVVGRLPLFRIVGWISGADAKQPQYVQLHGGRPAAYFVPQSTLHSLDNLGERIAS